MLEMLLGLLCLCVTMSLANAPASGTPCASQRTTRMDANLRTKHLTLIDRGYKVFANADTVILEHDYSTCYTDDGVH